MHHARPVDTPLCGIAPSCLCLAMLSTRCRQYAACLKAPPVLMQAKLKYGQRAQRGHKEYLAQIVPRDGLDESAADLLLDVANIYGPECWRLNSVGEQAES